MLFVATGRLPSALQYDTDEEEEPKPEFKPRRKRPRVNGTPLPSPSLSPPAHLPLPRLSHLFPSRLYNNRHNFILFSLFTDPNVGNIFIEEEDTRDLGDLDVNLEDILVSSLSISLLPLPPSPLYAIVPLSLHSLLAPFSLTVGKCKGVIA